MIAYYIVKRFGSNYYNGNGSKCMMAGLYTIIIGTAGVYLFTYLLSSYIFLLILIIMFYSLINCMGCCFCCLGIGYTCNTIADVNTIKHNSVMTENGDFTPKH